MVHAQNRHVNVAQNHGNELLICELLFCFR